MCATSGMGCDVEMSVEDERDIFAESMSRAIIEVKAENCEAFEAMLDEAMACEKIGRSTRLNSSHRTITYAVSCLKKKNK